MAKARVNSDPTCPECMGAGWTWSEVVPDDRFKVYCYCAMEKIEQSYAESREE